MNSFEQWLAEIGLESYAATFTENEVDFSVAGTLSEADLRELGLTLGARKKFLLAAASLAKPTTANQEVGRVLPAEQSPEPITALSTQRRTPPAHRHVLRPSRFDCIKRKTRP